jgi:cellulose synthase/poly-beta-1,6-N-acetylglucosamine synthase-like glycosyltransferase
LETIKSKKSKIAQSQVRLLFSIFRDEPKVVFKGVSYIYSDFLKLKQPDVDISVVIPAYNEEKRLPSTLEATVKYFQNSNFELIVVNDSSKD